MLSDIHINTLEDSYLFDILNTINNSAQIGINAMVYEINTINNNSIQYICIKIKENFPEVNLTINNKRIYIDWS